MPWHEQVGTWAAYRSINPFGVGERIPKGGSGHHAHSNHVQQHNHNEMELQGSRITVERIVNDRDIGARNQNGNAAIIQSLQYVGNQIVTAIKMRRIGQCLYYIFLKPHSFSKGTRRPVHPSKSIEEGKAGKSMKNRIRGECKDDF